MFIKNIYYYTWYERICRYNMHGLLFGEELKLAQIRLNIGSQMNDGLKYLTKWLRMAIFFYSAKYVGTYIA